MEVPDVAFPGDQAGRRRSADAFPPRLVLGGQAHVGEDGVAMERVHHVGIGVVARAGRDPKKASLGIDGVQVAVGPDFHPGDVVAHGPDAIALAFQRGNHHGQVGLAAGAGECRGHVGDFAAGSFEAQDEHVLRHPALIASHGAGDAQRETLFAEQGIAAVARAHAPDQFLLREVHDVAPHGVEVAEGMQSGHEIVGGAQAVLRDFAHARHDAHAGHHVGAVGDFHADFAERRLHRAHDVGNHVHGAAAHGAVQQHADFVLGAVGVHPVIGGADVVFAGAAMKVRCSVRATSLGLLRCR